jgi:Ca2+-binding RTX toxin-like protein
MRFDPTHFFACGCPACAGHFSAGGDSVGVDSAGSGSVSGGASASATKPVFTLAQIEMQLRTQWGGNQEGKTWTWLNTTTVTYSIDTNVTGQSEASGLAPMTPLMEDRARLAFELWDDLIALTLNESPGNANANITFNYSSNTSGGGTYAEWTGYSSGTNFGMSRAYIWLNTGWSSHNTDASMAFGGWGFTTYLHEIGHTLGLSHAGTYDAGNGGTITYANNAEYAQDSLRYTVMSYFDATDAEPFVDHASASGVWKYAQTPLLHDIAAIQAVYGADTTTRTGDTVYGFNSTAGRVVYDFAQNPDPILVIWDSGGTDTLDCSGYSTNQLINLTAGTYSNIGYLTYNVAIAFNCTIENATGGTGADTINGNGANNVILGGGGADTIGGADGNDILNGGAGNDVIWGGAGDDTFVFSTGADTIKDFTAGTGGIDEIDLRTVSGVTSLADVLARATQSGAHAVISFGSGNTLTLENVNKTSLVSSDFLFSAPPSGTDLTASSLVLNGTSISFAINNPGIEAAAASTTGIYLSTDSTITSADTLVTSIATSGLVAGGSVTQSATLNFPGNLTPGTYYLGVLADYNGQVAESSDSNNASNTVALILGNDSANTLTGTSGANILFGLAGNDIINGGGGNDTLYGGAGVDQLFGGDGDDLIYWDANDDLANVQGGNGYDTLIVVGTTLPSSFNLATHGFEATQAVLTDTGNNAWNIITDNYDTAWRLLTEQVVNDDNSSRITTYDATGSLGALHHYTDYLTAAGVRTAQEAYNDNGSGCSLARTTVYYASGAANYIDDFNAAGQRTSQEYFRADGTRQQSTVWDATGSLGAIDFYQDFFNTSGLRTAQAVYYDGRVAGDNVVDYRTTTWTTPGDFTHGVVKQFDLADPSTPINFWSF